MPYIQPKRRLLYDALIEEFDRVTFDDPSFSPGDLNYIITRFFHSILDDRKLNYALINDFIGVLECCKLELYRRIISDYEDQKIEENGDVL